MLKGDRLPQYYVCRLKCTERDVSFSELTNCTNKCTLFFHPSPYQPLRTRRQVDIDVPGTCLKSRVRTRFFSSCASFFWFVCMVRRLRIVASSERPCLCRPSHCPFQEVCLLCSPFLGPLWVELMNSTARCRIVTGARSSNTSRYNYCSVHPQSDSAADSRWVSLDNPNPVSCTQPQPLPVRCMIFSRWLGTHGAFSCVCQRIMFIFSCVLDVSMVVPNVAPTYI